MKLSTMMMMGLVAALGMFTGASAFAEEVATTVTHSGMDLGSLGAGLGLGLAALGGALGQGRTAGSALEGIARNPSAYNQIFLPMIIGLALIESLVIYALIIAFTKMH